MAHLDEIRALRDRLEAENVSLREEVQSRHDFDEIVGQSLAIRPGAGPGVAGGPDRCGGPAARETGTGKELIRARAAISAAPGAAARLSGSTARRFRPP